MNYLHDYHAGCAADVFKHLILLALIDALKKKDSAFCYIDTHAGGGIYDLTGESAQKTGEYLEGIAKLINQPVENKLLQHYVSLVQKCNNEISDHKTQLQFYPGSPSIVRSELRIHDRMLIMDFKKPVYDQLKTIFAKDKQTQVHHYDGYLGLKAFLPPKEKRGLVLIDPAYEDIDEFKLLIQHIDTAYHKWSTGIYAIWYPIKNRKQINLFHKDLINLNIPKILISEFCPWPDDVPTRLNGSGIIIINPPWQIENVISPALKELMNYLKQHKDAHTKTWRLKINE